MHDWCLTHGRERLFKSRNRWKKKNKSLIFIKNSIRKKKCVKHLDSNLNWSSSRFKDCQFKRANRPSHKSSDESLNASYTHTHTVSSMLGIFFLHTKLIKLMGYQLMNGNFFFLQSEFKNRFSIEFKWFCGMEIHKFEYGKLIMLLIVILFFAYANIQIRIQNLDHQPTCHKHLIFLLIFRNVITNLASIERRLSDPFYNSKRERNASAKISDDVIDDERKNQLRSHFFFVFQQYMMRT